MNFENFKKWPYFDDADINAVTEVLRSAKVNRWTGTKNIEFENLLCKITGAKHAIALGNGTLALEIALYALGIGEGDEVITTCRTFMASASAVVMRNARPVVADIDLNSQNITAETIRKCITPKTKAIIAVHLGGMPCEMDEIMALAKEYNLKVIEDCAQAHGALYKGKSVGTIGDIGAWSFCQDKIITTCGEGGAVTTNDESLWRKMWEFKDHGKSYDAVFNRTHPEGFRWLIESFGTNYRLSEMACAQGILWLKKLESWIEIRNRHAKALSETFKKFKSIRVQEVPAHIRNAFYKYYCFVNPENLKDGWSRDRIAKEISAKGVPCFSGACWNVSNEKCFVDKGWDKSKEELPNAFKVGETSLMLLVHPTLTDDDINGACKIIEEVLNQATL